MTTPSTRPLKVFLCHAFADKPAVRKLYRYLRSKKMDPWLDEYKLLPGQRWEEEIPKALYASDAIIVVLSQNSVTKEGYVQREIKFALDKALDMPEGRIFLIPARLEECEVPSHLRGYQWVDLFQKNWNRRLMSSLNIRAAQLGLTLLSASGETQPPVQNTPTHTPVSHVQFIAPETEEASIEAKPSTEKPIAGRPSQDESASVTPGTLEQSIPKEFPGVVPPKEIEQETEEKRSLDSEELSSDHSPLELRVDELSHELPQKKVTTSKFSPRLIGGVISGFFVISLLIWGASKLPVNPPVVPESTNSPEPTKIGTSQTISTSASQTAETNMPLPTRTLTSPTQTPIPPTSTLVIGSMMTGNDGMILLYVPAGEFTMGSDNGESNEKPAHPVYLDAFWIDRTEVTNAMYSNCVNDGECKEPGETTYYSNSNYARHPVVYVSWDDAINYCSWADRRLPTEAEWEKAASWNDSTKEKYVYPWGNDFSCTNGNFDDETQASSDVVPGGENCDGFPRTSSVGSFSTGTSPYGALDMAGNVWEWVSSLYKPSPYDATDGREDLSVSGDRVLRGGAWVSPVGYYVRSAFRYGFDQSSSRSGVGFRCSRSP